MSAESIRRYCGVCCGVLALGKSKQSSHLTPILPPIFHWSATPLLRWNPDANATDLCRDFGKELYFNNLCYEILQQTHY